MLLGFAVFWAFLAWWMPARAAQPDGYPTPDEIAQRLQALAAGGQAELQSLGCTADGADIPLLIVGGDHQADKPAIVIVGDTGGSPAAAPLVVGMAEQLVQRLTDPEQARVLGGYTYYFIPVPSPAGYARLFDSPLAERFVNSRPADEDADYQVDEDGFEDLNGDGLITHMRVATVGGRMRTHPRDPRLTIDADASLNEQGQFEVYSEGVDNDEDGLFNEDPPGGVDFNRNFTFNYPYFEAGAGPHQVSEQETRAVADFLFNHPNVALVLTFAQQENLVHPWRPGDVNGGPQSGIDGRDDGVYQHLAKVYRELLPEDSGVKSAPESGRGAGSFVEWAYFHYGRWSISARPWWPAEPAPEEAAAAEESGEEPVEIEDVGDRGKDGLRVLQWNDQAGAGRFVEWQIVDHPDFPGKTVEVGGFVPYAASMPQASELASLATLHTDYLCELARLMPQILLEQVELVDRGGGVFRLEVKATNLGFLPTASALGNETGQLYPLQFEIELPAGATLLDGWPRGRMERLAGNGGNAVLTWLIDAPAGGVVHVAVASPSVGSADLTVDLSPAEVTHE